MLGLPMWWASLWGGVLLTCLTLWVLASRRGRARRGQDSRDHAPALTAPATSWMPQTEVMGLVSGWPHSLDAPDDPPAGSPEDRPDLWAMLP